MTRIRALPALALAAASLAAPAAAAAHADLISADPPDGAELEEAPTEIVLTFDDELDPTASGFVVTDASDREVGRGEVDLDVAERNVVRGSIDVDGPGRYTVTWTITAGDGHTSDGSYTFTVAGDTDATTPDTAVATAEDRPHPMPAIGLALLAVAAALGAGRLRVVEAA